MGLAMKLRHDLDGGNGKAKRGWKGLALVGRIDAGTGEMGPGVRGLNQTTGIRGRGTWEAV